MNMLCSQVNLPGVSHSCSVEETHVYAFSNQGSPVVAFFDVLAALKSRFLSLVRQTPRPVVSNLRCVVFDVKNDSCNLFETVANIRHHRT